MKQITFFACDAGLCAAENPDELTASIGCRSPGFDRNEGSVCADLLVMIRTSLRGSIDLGGFLHRWFDLDVRSLNLWKNSRSGFFKQPLVVLID